MAEVKSKSALVLASGSRTRYDILKSAGLAFTVDPADIDEQAIRTNLGNQVPPAKPRAVALELAAKKALATSPNHQNELVIGSDQILEHDGVIFSKPNDRVEALQTLKSLRGKTHALHSAVVIARREKVTWQHVETANLTMRFFSDEFADDYARKVGDDAFACVGAYQIEGPGIQLFEKVEGDYFTILGLPLLPLLAELREMGELNS